jgi:hypothetical protein
MKYYEPYIADADGRTIILVGIGFDPSQKNIADYANETIGEAEPKRLFLPGNGKTFD